MARRNTKTRSSVPKRKAVPKRRPAAAAKRPTRRTSPRRPKRGISAVLLIILITGLLGAVLGACAFGLYGLFLAADHHEDYRAAVIIPSATPTASPVPAGWQRTAGYAVPILMYHYVRPVPQRDQIGRGLSVSPEAFARQLGYLTDHGYVPITFEQLQRGILPPKPVILTFDDGPADAYTAVYPALKQRGLAGVFYVISGFVDHPGSVSWEQLRTMQRAGMEIGAHTVTHPDLAKASEREQAHQIFDSIREIQRQLGRPVITFAYPSGRETPETVRLLRQAGISYSVTVNAGTARNTDDPQLLPRYRMNDTTDLSGLLP